MWPRAALYNLAGLGLETHAVSEAVVFTVYPTMNERLYANVRAVCSKVPNCLRGTIMTYPFARERGVEPPSHECRWLFLYESDGRGMKLIAHPHLMAKLRMRGAVPPLSPIPS